MAEPAALIGQEAARQAAAHTAREAYGRLLAWLAWRWRDLAAAEDALGAALLAALETWPERGVPRAPEAWLLTVAKRELLQARRHQAVVDDPAVTAVLESAAGPPDAPAIPDERLRLLFACAHPAIEPSIRTPLMLQVVLGLDAAQVASAFLVAPATMAQRLVRAKRGLREAGVRFETPEADELAPRLHAVLEAIYAAYGTGWDATLAGPAAAQDDGFTGEALFLAELVAARLPQSAEALGLLALLGFCEARRAARLDASGRFVPLDRQDVMRWDHARIAAADALLWQAAQQHEPGPFQLEAAIQSAHCQRAYGAPTPWARIAELYSSLLRLAPSTGAAVGAAVAVAAAGDPAQGLAMLDALPAAQVASYQPWWVARADLLIRLGQQDAALQALDRALGLTPQRPLAEHLQARRATLQAAPEENSSLDVDPARLRAST